jgi:hypothetical protein
VRSALPTAVSVVPFFAFEAASPRAANALPPVVTTLTLTVPVPSMPMLWAAAFDRSMIRPPTKGPRSLMRTTTERPFDKFSTRTLVPNGSERCAAVSSLGFICSPLAVRE